MRKVKLVLMFIFTSKVELFGGDFFNKNPGEREQLLNKSTQWFQIITEEYEPIVDDLFAEAQARGLNYTKNSIVNTINNQMDRILFNDMLAYKGLEFCLVFLRQYNNGFYNAASAEGLALAQEFIENYLGLFSCCFLS